MRFAKFSLVILLLFFFPQIPAQAQGLELKSIRVEADANDIWGEVTWPWGKSSSGTDAYMSWDKITEGSYTYDAGYLFFKARNDREQPGLEGVDDDVELNLNFDVENLRLTGNLRAYTVSTYSYDLFTGYVNGDWVNYGFPSDWGKGFTYAVCETWVDFLIDLPMTYDEYYKKASVNDEVIPIEVTYKAAIRRFSINSGAPEKIETRTRSVNMDIIIRASVYNFGEDVYVQFNIWPSKMAVSDPNVIYQLECGNPCTAISEIQWKEEDNLSVSGQEVIALGSEPISFGVTGSLDAESYTWIISYKHKNGFWVELDPIDMTQKQPLTLTATSDPGLSQLRGILYEQGVKVGDIRELDMRVQVTALKSGETTVSNEHNFKLRLNEELTLTITGLQKITNDIENIQTFIKFTATGTGEGVAQVRWVDWYFYYKDATGEWQLVHREDVDGGIQDLEIPWVGEGLNWDYWTELAGYHGEDVDDLKILEMKALAKAVSYAETEIASSNEHHFTVEYIKKFQLLTEKKITVHPAGSNSTQISVDYGTLELSEPIKLSVIRKPHFIDVKFSPETLETNVHGVSSASMKISTNNYIDEPLLPTTGLLIIQAASGSTSTTREIELKIVPAEWLVLYYTTTDTPNSLQQGEELNILSLIEGSRESSKSRVGTIAILELEKPWQNKNTKTQPLDVATLQGGQTYMLEILDGNVTLIGGEGLGQLNLGSESTLKQFVESAQDRIPAEKKLLVISDHGEGVRGVVFDKSPYDRLEPAEIRNALEWNHVDVILFDACYMSQLEALYEVYKCADYIVASEVTMPSIGINYKEILSRLVSTPSINPKDLASLIMKNFTPYEKWDQHLAVIETSKLPPIVDAVGKLSDTYIELFTMEPGLAYLWLNLTLKSSYLCIENRGTRDFPQYIGHPYYDLITLTSMMSILPNYMNKLPLEQQYQKLSEMGYIGGELPTLAEMLESERLMEQIINYSSLVSNLTKSAVIENKAQVYLPLIDTGVESNSSYNGVSIFFWPQANFRVQNNVIKDYERYIQKTSFSRDTTWQQLVQNFLFISTEESQYNQRMKDFIKKWEESIDNIFFKLHHSKHELYPHVYTSDGLHVGVNGNHWSKTNVDLDIPGSFYYDYGNGTKIISVPGTPTGYTITVDGTKMEEQTEDYFLRIVYIEDNSLVSEVSHGGEIKLATIHEATITLGEGKIELGEINVMGPASSEPPDDEGQSPVPGIPGFSHASVLVGMIILITLKKVKYNPLQRL